MITEEVALIEEKLNNVNQENLACTKKADNNLLLNHYKFKDQGEGEINKNTLNKAMKKDMLLRLCSHRELCF